MEALQEWCKLWPHREVTEVMASTWTAAIVRHVSCGESKTRDPTERKPHVRPSLCSEALTKLAGTATIVAVKQQISEAVAPHQLGCGVSAGATLIITATRAWVYFQPIGSTLMTCCTPHSRHCWGSTWRMPTDECTTWRRIDFVGLAADAAYWTTWVMASSSWTRQGAACQ